MRNRRDPTRSIARGAPRSDHSKVHTSALTRGNLMDVNQQTNVAFAVIAGGLAKAVIRGFEQPAAKARAVRLHRRCRQCVAGQRQDVDAP